MTSGTPRRLTRSRSFWILCTILGGQACQSDLWAVEGRSADRRATAGRSILDRQPSGPLFRTLDAFAGGIELVLEKTVLSGASGKRGCDHQACDDGCDTLMLHQLELVPAQKVEVPSQPHVSTELPSVPRPLASEPSPIGSGSQSMVPVEPTFDRPVRNPLPQPSVQSNQAPATTPTPATRPAPRITMPQVPVDPKPRVPVKAQKPEPIADDGWIDSFAPSGPTPSVRPRLPVPMPNQDEWTDPFEDDPQTWNSPGNSRSSAISQRDRIDNSPPQRVKPTGYVRRGR